MSLYMIPQDKANHIVDGALGSAAIMMVAFLAHLILPFSVPWSMAAFGPVAVAAVLGASKELSDKIIDVREQAAGAPPSHDVDVFDFLATTAGGVPLSIMFAMGAAWT